MKHSATIIILILTLCDIKAQQIDTFLLEYPISKYDTIGYNRIIEYISNDRVFHVRDYFMSGQIQMDAYYSKFDKKIKEELQCNYHSNTKEGFYQESFENGQLEYSATYKNGLRNGLSTSWYKSGIKESEEHWLQGQLNGKVKYWTEQGELQFDLEFKNGLNLNPLNVSYHYIDYLPSDYNSDTTKTWPLIIFLHGGSARGEDTLDLYDYGPFDQIYRGREFPFIIVAPQCPKHIRWSTDNWFDSFYNDLMDKFRIDTNRIYLTGASLGGSGTWYLATKYPERFAAIAPISGFTRHMDYLSDNFTNLKDIPIWAFHGEVDNVVPFEETEYLINKLQKINNQIKFTREKEVGHWIHHLIYPGEELYDWFLKCDKRLKGNN